MSNLANTPEQPCDTTDSPCSAIEMILKPRSADLGAFSVRRALPTAKRKMVGPWIFFDHMGPAHFSAGQGINVRPHPHIGIATVTYLFEGEILHRDSLGSVQLIRPGDINLMVAGRGIVHSERERPEITETAHTLHGLQLWLALPESVEAMEPAFYHYPDASIPAATVNGATVRIMMGSAYGQTSPVQTFSDTLYVEAYLDAGQTLVMPEAEDRAVYVANGGLQIDGSELAEHTMAIIRPTVSVELTATVPSRIAIIGGERFGRRHIEWNFVASRREWIDQAKRDWQNGLFPTVPGDEDEFIPLPGP